MGSFCFIPARGGSKRVVNKNIVPFGGSNLVSRAVRTAVRSRLFDKIIISSDCNRIISNALSEYSDLIIHSRPSELSRDESQIEESILDWINSSGAPFGENDTMCMMQVTSPFLDSKFLSQDLKLISSSECRSVISGFEVYPFVWKTSTKTSLLETPSYNVHDRPRTQDLDTLFVETGGFYFFYIKDFLETKNRIAEPVGKVTLDLVRGGIDINTQDDLDIATELLPVLDCDKK